MGREDPRKEGMANPLLYFCLENPCGQRTLAGYRPQDHKESDMTESRTELTFRQEILHCLQGPDGLNSYLIATLKKSQPDLQV